MAVFAIGNAFPTFGRVSWFPERKETVERSGKTPNEIVGRLFDYDNFRLFLRDFIAEEKRIRPGFSQRLLSQRLGLGSPTMLSLVLKGDRNLGEGTLQKLPGSLGLAGRPAHFLVALARFNQARRLEERESTFQELKRIRKSGRFARTLSHQYPYWDEWYHVVVRELAVHSAWKGDHAKLGALVRPPISADKARQSVAHLCELGLLERSPDGSYAQSDPVVSAEGAPTALLREFKREMVLRGLEAMESVPPRERHFSTATISISRSSFALLSSRIDTLRAEFLQAAHDEDPEVVVQVNFQAFPVSRPIGAPEGGVAP